MCTHTHTHTHAHTHTHTHQSLYALHMPRTCTMLQYHSVGIDISMPTLTLLPLSVGSVASIGRFNETILLDIFRVLHVHRHTG